MGELQAATEAVSPIWALIYPFIPVVILLGFWAAAGVVDLMMTMMMILVEVRVYE